MQDATQEIELVLLSFVLLCPIRSLAFLRLASFVFCSEQSARTQRPTHRTQRDATPPYVKMWTRLSLEDPSFGAARPITWHIARQGLDPRSYLSTTSVIRTLRESHTGVDFWEVPRPFRAGERMGLTTTCLAFSLMRCRLAGLGWGRECVKARYSHSHVLNCLVTA